MKKLIKLALLLVVLAVVVLVGAVVGVGMYANSLAKKGIERGGTYALGVPTTLGGVNIGLLSGRFSMSDLDVANPSGFSSPHFLSLGTGAVAVSYSSLQEPTVELPELTLAKIDMSLEKKGGKSNYQVILDNLKKLQDRAGGGGTTKPSGGGEETKYVINKLSITNVTIHVDMLDAGGLSKLANMTIPIEKIELQNVGKTGTGVEGTGVTMEQLVSIIVQAVMSATMQNAGSKLPEALMSELTGQLGQLDALKGLQLNVAGDLNKVVDNLGKGVGDALKGAEKDLGDKLGKGLGDLIGGDKNKKDDKKK